MIDAFKYLADNNIDQPITAVNNIEFRAIINVLKINTAVEIGTYHGATAAYIAQFADHVHTFDIVDCHTQKIWDDLDLSDKISFYHVQDKKEIAAILQDINFDFAFIDNGHTYEDCKEDFELVKRCGRVLFHDVNPTGSIQIVNSMRGVRQFTDELGNVRIVGNNGYWSG